MENVVLLNQKNVIDYIVKIDKKLRSDKKYRKETYDEYLPCHKYNTNQNYIVISRIVSKDLGIKGYGKITVWRILKIYNESKEGFARIRNGESIRTVYKVVFNVEDKPKEEKIEVVKEIVDEPHSFEDCRLLAEKIKNFLVGVEADESIEEDMEKVRRGLFMCSKTIKDKQSEIAKKHKWEQEF